MDVSAPSKRLPHRFQPDLEEQLGCDREKRLPEQCDSDFEDQFDQRWPRDGSTAARGEPDRWLARRVMRREPSLRDDLRHRVALAYAVAQHFDVNPQAVVHRSKFPNADRRLWPPIRRDDDATGCPWCRRQPSASEGLRQVREIRTDQLLERLKLNPARRMYPRRGVGHTH